jgi:protein-L-isoaspartate O-methyltransferase
VTNTVDQEWAKYAQALAALLYDRGDIRSIEWRDAVAEVPRHVFVPRAYEQNNRGEWVEWDTFGQWERVYAPKTLVTALANRSGWLEPISSTTTPELMVRMLETLDIRDGHRVLEIGTGTGYNAALLSHRLGDSNVFSVDIGEDLVAAAQDRLATVGYRPTVVAADGQDGLPDHGPYDRIIATCSVPSVPRAWADQVAPNGSILVDVRPSIGAGNLVHLYRNGSILEGRFSARSGSFMAMRHHGDTPSRQHAAVQNGEQRAHRTDGPLQPWKDTPVAWFLAHLGGLPRGVLYGWELDPDTRKPTVATLTAPNGAQARVNLSDHVVTESGPMSLWEPVEWAHRVWVEAGEPGWDRIGLTVTPDEQRIWLDNADNDRRWILH